MADAVLLSELPEMKISNEWGSHLETLSPLCLATWMQAKGHVLRHREPGADQSTTTASTTNDASME
jgi:hypothetical protein